MVALLFRRCRQALLLLGAAVGVVLLASKCGWEGRHDCKLHVNSVNCLVAGALAGGGHMCLTGAWVMPLATFAVV